MEEFAFIDWIRSATQADAARVPVGPGDDCAVVHAGGEAVLVTTDQCGDGVHFALAECGPEAAGYKVMARSLSDIAAMAGVPLAAVATVALPEGFAEADAQAIYRGLRRAGDAFDCPVVGGDVSAWHGPLLLTVTMLGRPGPAGPTLRRGARADDALCVTGTLGGSLATGRHLRFVPRVREALALAERYEIHAMIDLSDGLASDLRHLCRESGLGAEVFEAALPRTELHGQAVTTRAALTDGEDYELLFALPAAQAEQLIARQDLGVPVSRIGVFRAGREIVLIDPAGRSRLLEEIGYRHRT